MKLTKLYDFAGGFGEFVVIISLVAAISLAATNRLTDAFAATLTAIGAFGVIHDQCTSWQDRKDKEEVQK
jgi:putative effector of murein hydrolase LrgA (UPF0299 family)